jgi:hypothetical protein
MSIELTSQICGDRFPSGFWRGAALQFFDFVFNYSGGDAYRGAVIGHVAKDNSVCSYPYVVSNLDMINDLGAGTNADFISDARSTQCDTGMNHYVITDYAIRVHDSPQSIVGKVNVLSHSRLVGQKATQKYSRNLLQHER